MFFNSATFFPSMKDKKIDVIGLGVSNTELVFRLVEAGAVVTVRDKRTEDQIRSSTVERIKERGVNLKLGENYLENLDGEIIFRTPGMHFNTKELVEARERGKIVTSELELFIELCPCKTIGITGSDGKTTTSTLIAEMLRKSGKKVHLGGNIGKPLLPILDKVGPDDICVVELSSFQLISMRCSPDIAVITNISPNHLDVHKDLNEYIDAKLNILRHQNAFSKTVLSFDNKKTYEFAPMVRGRLSLFSRKEEVRFGAWMDKNGDIYHSTDGRAVKLFNRKDVLLPGLHNIENLCAAISAVWSLASPNAIAEVAKTFTGVPHRIEFIKSVDGVKYYNDSIATTPTRTIAGISSFDEKLIVLLGGYDKLIPFTGLGGPICDRAKEIILMGPTAPKIEAVVKEAPNYDPAKLTITHAENLPDAVNKARSSAKKGDVVILSPACASFDSYQNFEERGEHFRELVNNLK